RLGDGCRAKTDARIVAARGRDLRRPAVDVDGHSRHRDARGGFESDAHDDLLTRRDPAQDAPGVIALETGRRELIAMFGTALFHGLEARADFHAFDGIDSHHG